MRILTIIPLFLLICLVWAPTTSGQTTPLRYGIGRDLNAFPQDSPLTLKSSILKSLEAGRIDYLIAHLTDPKFIDPRIAKSFEGKLENQARETKAKLVGTELGNQLKLILQGGQLTIKGNEAVIIHPKLGNGLIVRFLKIEKLWYMDNRKSQE